MPNDAEHGPMQRVKLGAQRLARLQHGLDHPLEHRLPGDQLTDAGHEAALAHRAHLEPEAAQ
jgi:hypothetical protein